MSKSRDNALVDRADHLLPLVKANASAKSNVGRAFAAFGTHSGRDWSEARDFRKGVTLAKNALKAWANLGEESQQRLLNGWRPVNSYPTPQGLAAIVKEAATNGGETVDRCLELTCSRDGRVDTWGDFRFSHGWTAPVTVSIREGTSRAETVACLKAALAAVESVWDCMIDRKPGSMLRARDAQGRAIHAAVVRKAGMASV